MPRGVAVIKDANVKNFKYESKPGDCVDQINPEWIANQPRFTHLPCPEPGVYWVKRKWSLAPMTGPIWEVGEFLGSCYGFTWQCFSSEGKIPHSEIAEIGPRVLPPMESIESNCLKCGKDLLSHGSVCTLDDGLQPQVLNPPEEK